MGLSLEDREIGHRPARAGRPDRGGYLNSGMERPIGKTIRDARVARGLN